MYNIEAIEVISAGTYMKLGGYLLTVSILVSILVSIFVRSTSSKTIISTIAYILRSIQ